MTKDKRFDLIFGVTILLLLVALAAITLGGGPACRPFATWERNAGSMSMFPERIEGANAERVVLLSCDGEVRVELQEFQAYQKNR